MSKWIIRDWTGKHVFTDETFDNFGSARDFISNYANDEVERTTKGMSEEDKENIYNGICEDLYAINIDENGKEIEDNGQYSY